MQIRGEITHALQDWSEREDRPLEDSGISYIIAKNIYVNPALHSPENAQELAELRAHFIEQPQGVLLDAYQVVTELDLKHPAGSAPGKDRYYAGLRDELVELSTELAKAQVEHPYQQLGKLAMGIEDSWLVTSLDHNRIRFDNLHPERKEKYLSELGDVLWYISRLAAESGTTMSKSFVKFLLASGNTSLETIYRNGDGGLVEARAAAILDFRIVQDLALSQKMAFAYKIKTGTLPAKNITVDSAPYMLLNRIIDEDLGQSPTVDVGQMIGKLIWFTAYTASSILNADYALVMKANLEKILARSRRGTAFNRAERSAQDEASIRGYRNPRSPMG